MRWSSRRLSCLAALAAGGLLAGGAALAQGGPGGGGPAGGGASPGSMSLNGVRPGPAPRAGGMSYGGSISGRINLIAPTTIPTDPSPALTPPPLFAPQRMDRLDGHVLDGIKLHNLNPAKPIRPAALPPAAAPETTPETLVPDMPIPAAPTPAIKQTLTMNAVFTEGGAHVPAGVKWRVFTEQPDANGEHLLVAESSEAAPSFDLDPGAYIVHAVYGLVGAAKLITVRPTEPSHQSLIIAAGGVRLAALVGDAKPPSEKVSFALTRDDGGMRRTVAEKVKPGEMLRLPAGAYHVVSSYGDANAVVEVDLKIAAGKLVDAQVHHKAAPVTLRLVDRPGGSELADTSWTILTPGGDVIRESIGALPEVVLAEGDYAAIARHDGRTFQRDFAVKAGVPAAIEISLR